MKTALKPTAHTDQSRKRSFKKTPAFRFSVAGNILKTDFSMKSYCMINPNQEIIISCLSPQGYNQAEWYCQNKLDTFKLLLWFSLFTRMTGIRILANQNSAGYLWHCSLSAPWLINCPISLWKVSMRFLFCFFPIYRMWSLHCRKIQLKKGIDLFCDCSSNDQNRLCLLEISVLLLRGWEGRGSESSYHTVSHEWTDTRTLKKGITRRIPFAPKQQRLLYYDDK